jgi:hypothetical protein
VLIVHAGNRIDAPGRAVARFPADHVASVRSRVRLLLSTLQPSLVVSNAAAGSDLVVLHEAQQLGIATRVIVPIAQDEFVRQSVADSGAEWLDSFHEVLRYAGEDRHSDVVHCGLPAEGEWFAAANARLLDEALRCADEATPPVPVLALTIRPKPVANNVSMTDHFAGLAEQAGLLVVTLDPRSEPPSLVLF